MKHLDITKFAKYCGLIKTTKRAGWLRYLPSEVVESVSDHSCRMGLLTLALCKYPGIDHKKCMQFAIMHDLAQGITGDFTPYDKITAQQKVNKQLQAMNTIFNPLDEQTKQYLLDVWRRYQEQEQIESRIVKDIDKYQMMQQAMQYQEKYKVDLGQFFNCAKNIKTDVIKEWTSQLLAKRSEYINTQSK